MQLFGMAYIDRVLCFRLLMIAAAAFFLVGIVHGNGVWFGGW
jgi:hypothetical protein